MGRCSRYKEKNLICFIVKGYAKCNGCTGANVKYCNGCFSDAEFNSIERQKESMKRLVKEQRAEVGRLAVAAASAFAALTAAQ
jgi:hypothetical protein